MTLTALFERQAAATPERRAIVAADGEVTYSALNRHANQLAHCLRAEGVVPGDRVSISLEPGIDLLIAILAVLKAGAAYVPLDPAYPPERLAYMVAAAQTKTVVTREAFVPRFAEAHPLVLDRIAHQVAALPGENPPVAATPDSLLYVIFTSGSTGQPKGAGIFHRGFVNLLNWFTGDFAISAEDRTLLVSSISFDLTQKNLFAPLVTGGELHIPPPGPFDPAAISREITSRGITLLNCTPSAFYPLVESANGELCGHLSTLRTVFLGGESINPQRLAPWIATNSFRCEIVNTYGPTECTDICAFHRLSRADFEGGTTSGPIGHAVPGATLHVLDENRAPADAGELWIGGLGVGAGYVNDAALTEQKFIQASSGERLYRTGDSVRTRVDGALEFLGRIDHQVKLHGFRVEPGEIEATLAKAPGVREAVVVVDQSGTAPALLAFITPAQTVPDWQSALRTFAQAHLPAHMVPNSFVALDAFPHSPNGKIDRPTLRNRAPLTAPIPRAGDHFQNETQRVLAQIWREVLGLAEVGLDDNFFDLGGNSLRLIQCQSWLRSRVGADLPITDLFQHVTIRQLAARLASQTGATVAAPQLADRAQARNDALARKQRLVRATTR